MVLLWLHQYALVWLGFHQHNCMVGIAHSSGIPRFKVLQLIRAVGIKESGETPPNTRAIGWSVERTSGLIKKNDKGISPRETSPPRPGFLHMGPKVFLGVGKQAVEQAFHRSESARSAIHSAPFSRFRFWLFAASCR